MAGFTDEAWRRVAPIYAAILEHPFNRELAAGTLSRDRFRFYMLQDAHYLIRFGRALAVTAARAPDPDELIQFAGSAQAAVVVERALHEGFFRDYGLSPEEAKAAEPSPTCSHYVHFLLSTAHNAPYEVSVAALLPCFQIIGRWASTCWASPRRTIPTSAGSTPTPTRSSPGACARSSPPPTASPRRDAMQAAHRRAAQLEWMFWDAAYRMERWPV
jgi:thiaminase (transcriptional activator TenA)